MAAVNTREELARLVAQANRACAQSCALGRAAGGAITATRALQEVLRTSRLLRRTWWEHWPRVWHGPGDLVVQCVSCGKFQVEANEWIAAPAGISASLRDLRRAVISHGMCRGCAERLYPTLV
ncbi:MAG TPA: hypothetical protein VMY76_12770 [Gemmatimonadales bacterium]|nr:hypothetical protein [Gemmatimonadales bacterium]